MATTTSPARPTAGSTRRPRLQRWFSANLIRMFAVLAFAYIFFPVATRSCSRSTTRASRTKLAQFTFEIGPTRAVPPTSATPLATA